MKIMLDTTYLLPTIGIAIRGLPSEAPTRLLDKGHQISISHITLFELAAKGAQYINNGSLPSQIVAEGIRAIIRDDEIETIPFHDSELLLTSFELRKVLIDFIDCLIVSSAINHCDALITEDSEIHSLKKNNNIRGLIAATNPKFRIQMLNELL